MEQYDAEELMQYIQERKFRLLRARLSEMNEADIAEFLGELEDNPKVMVFRMLPKELAADVFAFLEPDVQEHIINSITDAELAKIIEDLFVDDAVDMLEEASGYCCKASYAYRRPGDQITDQPVLEIPGEQCWKYYDGRVYRPEKIHECGAGLCLYSCSWCG